MFQTFSILCCSFLLVLGLPKNVNKLPNLTIMGGDTADIADYPYQVVIRGLGLGLMCSAALISPTWVITTARCTSDAQTEVNHFNGSISIIANTANYSEGIEIPIKQYISHPDYFPFHDDNDIGLIELETSVECEHCQPIALTDASPNPGDIVTITGWGWTRDYLPDLLQVVQLPVLSATDCNNAYSDLPYTYLTEHQFCAGNVEEPFVGPCYQDEGDPAVSNGVLVGLVSQTFSCPGTYPYPRIFTDVFKFRDWIRNNSGI